jgi:putative membrane protein
MADRRLATIELATSLILPVSAWGEQRPWDSQWDMPPVWWPVSVIGAGLLLLILLGWVLLHVAPLVLAIVVAVLGIRWLKRSLDSSRSDPAIATLRERYARGEITKEEFDAKRRDLADA